MPPARRRPEFRLGACRIAQQPAVMRRNYRIPLIIYNDYRYRRNLPHKPQGAVRVIEEKGERVLQGPGEEETAQLLPGDEPVIGKGAVDD
jgi:hypothetical protein